MRGHGGIIVFIGISLVAASCDEAADQGTVRSRPNFMLASSYGCVLPETDTSTWQLVDGKSVSFRVPLGYSDRFGGGCGNSESTTYYKGDDTVGYCLGCAPYVVAPGCEGCREVIDGREALIITYRAPDGRYFAGATWWEVQFRDDQNPFLVFGGWSCDEEGQRNVLAAIRTVRIKEGN